MGHKTSPRTATFNDLLCVRHKLMLPTFLAHCLLQRRLQKELMSLMKEPPPGVTVDAERAGQNLTQ
jgi:hypothetical protein